MSLWAERTSDLSHFLLLSFDYIGLMLIFIIFLLFIVILRWLCTKRSSSDFFFLCFDLCHFRIFFILLSLFLLFLVFIFFLKCLSPFFVHFLFLFHCDSFLFLLLLLLLLLFFGLLNLCFLSQLVCDHILDAVIAGRDTATCGQHRHWNVVRFDQTGHDLKINPVISSSTILRVPQFSLLEGLIVFFFVCLAEGTHQLRENLAHIQLAWLKPDLGRL